MLNIKYSLFFLTGSLYFQVIRTMSSHNVFVYGTLKRNEPNHHWLTNESNGSATFVSEGLTKEKYPLIIATQYNIPFLLYSPGNGHYVKGEIYKVDDLMLSKLDVLEEHPKFYERELKDISATKTNETVNCWVYFIKSFKRDLLSQPTMDSYSSSGAHGKAYTTSIDDEDSPTTVDELLAEIRD